MNVSRLAPHLEIDAAVAETLALDPSFGLTSVPSGVVRGLLELRPRGSRQLVLFRPADDAAHARSAGDEVVAAEWAALAASSPPFSQIEIALGVLGHRDLHWRLVDVLALHGQDLRSVPLIERQEQLSALYRIALGLRVSRLEFAHLIGPHQGKDVFLAEGPGRPGDRLGFRTLAGGYDQPWLVAPVGWTRPVR